jgi:hypothetical protein
MIQNYQQGQPLLTNVDPIEVAKAAAIGAVGGAIVGGTLGFASSAVGSGVVGNLARTAATQLAKGAVGQYAKSVVADTAFDVGVDFVTAKATGETSFDFGESLVKNGVSNLVTGGFDKVAQGVDVATKIAPKLFTAIGGTAIGEGAWSLIKGDFEKAHELPNAASLSFGPFNNVAKGGAQLLLERFTEYGKNIPIPKGFERLATVSANFLSLPAKFVYNATQTKPQNKQQ